MLRFLSVSSLGVYSLLCDACSSCDASDAKVQKSIIDATILPQKSISEAKKQNNMGLQPLRSSLLHSEVSFSSPHCTAEKNCRFQIVYDPRTRSPKYVLEHITTTSESIAGTNEKEFGGSWMSLITLDANHSAASDKKSSSKKLRRRSFYSEDSLLLDAFKAHPNDYKNTLYDRGHMVPAADCQSVTSPNDSSAAQQLLDSTFSMVNICPQTPSLNKGFWAKFEAWIRYQLQNQRFDEIFIITGPAYVPSPVIVESSQLENKNQMELQAEMVLTIQTIGKYPKLIYVPTHFFKTIIGIKKQTSVEANGPPLVSVGSFLVPNNNEVDRQAALAEFVVRTDELEAIVGHALLPIGVLPSIKEYIDAPIPKNRVFEDAVRKIKIQKGIEGSSPRVPSMRRRKAKEFMTNSDSMTVGGKKLLVEHLCDGMNCNVPLSFSKS